jgi:hypothetical protein
MGPDFSADTRQLIAFRASLICTNPACNTLTVGPSDALGPLALKLGEAAHIYAARPKQARYVATMSDESRAHQDNGIWLCASCHTMIDKNMGADFPAEMLSNWRRRHEEKIKSLLYSHRSPLPAICRFTEEGQLAQDVVDALENHGALFVDPNLEVSQHVTTSLDRLRSELQLLARRIRYDDELKNLIKDIVSDCREYMNSTSRSGGDGWHHLRAMRDRIGIKVLRLRDDYKCQILGPLNRIIPR